MEEQLAAFLSYLQQERRYSDNTVAAYRNDLSQFLEFTEERSGAPLVEWAAVTDSDIQLFLSSMELKDPPYASSTVARKVAALKSFYNYLLSQKIVQNNPTIELESPKVNKRLPQIISADEIERLLDAPGADSSPKSLRDRALLNILYETGMRVSEVVSIQLKDVDLQRSNLSSPNRLGEGRDIPLTTGVMELLARYLQEGRPHLAKGTHEQALFLNHRGEKLTRQGLWLIIKGYAKDAGLDANVTPNTLRHSFAVYHLNKGVDLEEIQRMLGHANISTTQIYTHME